MILFRLKFIYIGIVLTCLCSTSTFFNYIDICYILYKNYTTGKMLSIFVIIIKVKILSVSPDISFRICILICYLNTVLITICMPIIPFSPNKLSSTFFLIQIILHQSKR